MQKRSQCWLMRVMMGNCSSQTVSIPSTIPAESNVAEWTVSIEQGDLHVLSTPEFVLWSFLYTTVALFAIFANLLVVYVVLTRPRLQNTTNIFIVNLSISDALTGLLAIPFKFQAALLQTWHLPDVMCSLVPFVETVSLSVSVFTLTATAVDRFRIVMRPEKQKITQSMTKWILICIWAFSIAFSIPYGTDHRVVSISVDSNYTISMVQGDPPYMDNSTLLMARQCLPIHADQLWWKAYNIYLTIVQYFVPVLIVDGAYLLIGYQVWLTQPLLDVKDVRIRIFQQNKKRVVKMLIIVVLVFTFCWLPYETYLVLNELWPQINEYYYINVVFFYVHWLAMSNSCINPIIYGIYNEKFKREYLAVFYRFCGRKTAIRKRSSASELDSQMVAFLRSEQLERSVRGSCHCYIATELGKDG